MNTVDCNAIIINSKPFFEYDKRCECLSPTLGKFNCLAKYITKPKSKKMWALDPLTEVRFTLFKGRSFYIIQNYSLLNSFEKIRSSFNHLQYALFFAHIIKKSMQANQINPDLYTLLKNTLHSCNQLEDIPSTATLFYKSYLKHEGLTPLNTRTLNETNYLNLITEYIDTPLKKPLQLDATSTYPVK